MVSAVRSRSVFPLIAILVTLAARSSDTHPAAVRTSVPAAVGAAAATRTLLLTPEDTSLSVDGVNHSAQPLLMAYTWPDNQMATAILLKFDLSALPAGATVEQAAVNLALVESDTTADATYTMTAHKQVGMNPIVAAATGHTADGVTPWRPSDCCHNSVPLAQNDLSAPYALLAVDKTPGVKTWTITTMVREWLANPGSNFGVVLNADTTKVRDRYRSFASTKHQDATLWPVLEITYSMSAADTTPPVISAVGSSLITGVTARIGWTTDEPSYSQVEYGSTTAYGSVTGVSASMATVHSRQVSGLLNARVYHYRVRSVDAAGNLAVSGDRTFKTIDKTVPAVSISAPAAGATVRSTVTVSAQASDNVGVAGVQFRLDSVNLGVMDTTAPYAVSWNTTTATRGSHTLTAVARDAAGNTRTSTAISVTVSNDTTAPAISITSPAAGSTISGAVTLAASASDNVGVSGVQFKLDGVNVGTEDTTAPYSWSWITTSATNGVHTLTAVARDAVGNQTTSAGVTVTVSNGVPPPPGGGLAALYPGDTGIENHPDVIFVERFEEPTLADLFTRWTEVLKGAAMSLTSDVPPGSPGARSLNIPWAGGGVNNGGHLFKQLSPGVDDTLYVRYYMKYPVNGKYHHTGIWMGGNNPSLSWPNPQAGIKPLGNDRFIAGAEQNTLTTGFDHYNYWMNMRPDGTGMYWGNFLLNNPSVDARAGQWTCVEHMVKLNNPTTAFNGEHAIWLDGIKVSHLGQGFPNGSWSGGRFTQNSTGSPFEGFRWRSSSSLNLNWIWLQNYSPDDPAGFAGNMSFDHVVVARKYIGCLASGSPDATPPTVSSSAPAAGSTVSGSAVTVSATASDNVGVTGVQFKLDGVDLGAQDTASPFSISWNTTTAPNGHHTLSAVARDAAGNTTTSAAVTVTVGNSSGSRWPNEPAGFTTINDQPWNLLAGNGWGYLRRTASKDGTIVLDASAPFSPLSALRIVFTTDMRRDTEPSVHWISLPRPTEIYSGWWMKVSPNWSCSPAGCGKITFLFSDAANGAGVTYSNLANAGGGSHYVNIATTWPSTGYRFWEPNVTKTVVAKDQWFRVEWYVKWASSPGATDGIIRWWVNGVLNGDYRTLPFPAIAGFIEYQHASTMQDVPPAEQYMYIDHTYVSKR